MSCMRQTTRNRWPNQSAAANRRPAGQADRSGNLFATVAADRAFPAAVAELGRSAHWSVTEDFSDLSGNEVQTTVASSRLLEHG